MKQLSAAVGDPETVRSSKEETQGNPRTLLIAVAVGVIVLNLYASQPLIELIGSEAGLSSASASLIPTLTMLGYATGLFLVVPLTDLLENRRLIAFSLAACVVTLLLFSIATTTALLLITSFFVGLTTSGIQMLVPMAALLAPPAARGRVLGNVMSGLMLGILFSRPAASLVADFANWRTFYRITAGLIALLALILARALPERRPAPGSNYLGLLASMWSLLRQEPLLRLRAMTQACCMAAFGIFWTCVAIRLSAAPFNLTQRGIAAFALAGAAGAIIAPLAGRAGDRGWTGTATLVAHASVLVAMLLAATAGAGLLGFTIAVHSSTALALLVASAVLLDSGVIADQALGRRAINLLRPEARGRLNGVFTGTFFIGGAIGAAISGIAWARGGWSVVCLVAAGFGLLALALFAAGRKIVPH
jgi:predicted MFS family arabinose efflux permease